MLKFDHFEFLTVKSDITVVCVRLPASVLFWWYSQILVRMSLISFIHVTVINVITMRKAFFQEQETKTHSNYLVAITSKKFRQAYLQGGI